MDMSTITQDRFLSMLTSDERTHICNESSKLAFSKGDLIIVQGETPPLWLGRVNRGAVELLFSTGAESMVLTTRRPGEWIGWFGVYPDRTNAFSIVAVTDLELDIFPQHLIRKAVETNTQFAQGVAGAIMDNVHLLHKNLVKEHASSALDRVETFPFRKRVVEVMHASTANCDLDCSLNKACEIMVEENSTAIVVLDSNKRAIGLITENDIVRVFANYDSAKPLQVKDVVSPTLFTIDSNAYLYQAIGKMTRRHIRHLPVMEDGVVLGMITMRDLMQLRSHGALDLISKIEEERKVDELDHLRKEAIPIFQAMLDESVPSLEIASLISHINAEIHCQAIRLTLEEMGSKPPVDFCLFVTGSHGRGENHLLTDQDHGIILSPYEVERHNEIESFYVPFTEKLTDKLAAAGLPYCEGNIMCRNPIWRKTFKEWQDHINILVARANKIEVRYLTLLADLKPIFGIESYGHELRSYFLSAMRQNKPAVIGLYEEIAEHKAPLGLFNRIITEKDKEHEGELDLKKSGVIFVIEALRILSIMQGIDKINTIDRLEALADIGILDCDSKEFIDSGFKILYRLLLRTQLFKIRSNQPLNTYIDTRTLSAKDKESLKSGLNAVKRLQSILHSIFGNIFL